MNEDQIERTKFLVFADLLDKIFPATHDNEQPGGYNILVLLADRDRLAAELANMKRLLAVALPHVEASAGAEHLFDGFRPQRRPLDGVVEEIRSAVAKPDERGG